jgi:hypothetical protein
VSKPWHEGLPDDDQSENDIEIHKVYEKALSKVRMGLEEGLGFDSACEGIDVEDKALREQIVDDLLKVLIAEEHFSKRVPLPDLAKRLHVSEVRLESAKESMLQEIQIHRMKTSSPKDESGDA